jgi:uncharacterized membrane protein YciS (DUF1049 family)
MTPLLVNETEIALKDLPRYKAAQIAFGVGVAPVMIVGFIASFGISVSFFEWFFFFGNWEATYFLGAVTVLAMAVGAMLAAPFWIAAQIQFARNKPRVRKPSQGSSSNNFAIRS